MIDPRLQTLRVLRAEGTVTGAAAALHLTPSTVSQQLRQLASELGVELLRPVGRRVQLTAAALTLIEHADVLHARWEEASAALDRHRTGNAGLLRVSGVATAIGAVVAPAMGRLRERYPEIGCHIGEHPGEDRFQLLLAGRVDIAVVIPLVGGVSADEVPADEVPADEVPADDARVEQRLLLEEPMDLLVPLEHEFAGRGSVELVEAAGEVWIQAGDPRDQHQLLLSAASSAGFVPRLEHSAVDWYAVASLVAHGHGVCLMPRIAPLPSELDLAVRRVPLSGSPAPARRLVAYVRRGSSGQTVISRGLAALEEAAGEWAAGAAGAAGLRGLAAGAGRRA